LYLRTEQVVTLGFGAADKFQALDRGEGEIFKKYADAVDTRTFINSSNLMSKKSVFALAKYWQGT
jgi:hypothetical protein